MDGEKGVGKAGDESGEKIKKNGIAGKSGDDDSGNLETWPR